MYGLLGWDNIWPRYNYLNIWNLRVKKIKNKNKNKIIEKIAFTVVQMKFLAMHITNKKLSFDIYGRKFTKLFHGTWSLLNILMIFGLKNKTKR